jgi:selenide,water dikinase
VTARLPRRLVLAGGGHAQVAVLRSLAMAPIPGSEITLINPQRETFYSGMLPGVLAGLLDPEECILDVAALAARARIRFLEDAAVGLDTGERQIELESGRKLPFDVLSIDIGSRMRDRPDPQVFPDIIAVRPLRKALPRITAALEAIRAGRRDPHLMVIGAGAAGVALAFGFRTALGEIPEAQITLLQSAAQILPDVSRGAQQQVLATLEDYGIEVRRGLGRLEPDAQGVRTAAGEIFTGATVVWATGAAPDAWLADSGLVTTGDGFLLTGADLCCRGTDGIFAAGDVAQIDQFPQTPRSGVHAVRQGPVLTQNLRASMRGFPRMQKYRPQKDFLRLLSTGDNRALAIYRGRARHGRAWWQLKKWIDRRFLARYRPPRTSELLPPDPKMQATMDDCGGCSAKLAPEVLEQAVFQKLPDRGSGPAGSAGSDLRLADRDDAAIFHAGRNGKVVVTTDAFPPFADDLALVAEIAAINAASDIYAMGADPRHALMLAGLPGHAPAGDLEDLLRGARIAFDAMDVEILGGHSVQMDSALIGYSVFGELFDTPLTKAGAKPGDSLVLSKPLGTGILLAAARGGECPTPWWESLIAEMRRSNAEAARILRDAGAHACTDISGFGLLGHTLEMMTPGALQARLFADEIPALPGARELAGAGWAATGSKALESYLAQVDFEKAPTLSAATRSLLLDPQTSGGLLAAVPAPAAELLGKGDSGTAFQIIGTVEEAAFQSSRITIDDSPAA